MGGILSSHSSPGTAPAAATAAATQSVQCPACDPCPAAAPAAAATPVTTTMTIPEGATVKVQCPTAMSVSSARYYSDSCTMDLDATTLASMTELDTSKKDLNTIAGRDPCPNMPKSMEIKYTCT